MANKKKSKGKKEVNLQIGKVIVSHRSEVIVENINCETFLCKSKKGAGRPICGDNIEFELTNENEGLIHKISPRRSTLTRPDSRGKIKSIAANIDQLIIVSSIVPEINFELVDRYIVAARSLGINPVLVLNKIDLADNIDEYEIILKEYGALGIPVIYTSIKTENGMSQFEEQLSTRLSILVGQSGVGKSSIIKHIIPDLEIRIGEISSYHKEGKHTTTATTLYHLDCGGDIIDSPGVRNFRLWNLSKEEIQSGFSEIHEASNLCKFNNCIHKNEPGCNVKAQVESGAISERRLNSFHQIIQSLELKY